MKKMLIASVVALAAAVCFTDTASAQQPCGGSYNFTPFGFYQPYGVQNGTSQPNAPYFSLNPPVYYGSRYARSYGMSPFAAPPMVSSPSGYGGRLRSGFHRAPTPGVAAPTCSTCYSQSELIKNAPLGAVRSNPFVETGNLAKN